MPDRIVEEELALLAQVRERLTQTASPHAPSEESLVKELEHLRDQLREGVKEEDRPALLQQWDRQSALLRQLRNAERPAEIDPGSPYFAHLRIKERGQVHEILLGKTQRLLPGVPIVDWRNAPVSKIFYRYRQGEEYEEEIAGRVREGEVLARRTVTIRDAALRRVEAPEGTFEIDATSATGWKRLDTSAARLGGGQGAAMRAHDVGDAEARLDRPHGFRRRADRHLPDIAALIDPAQFELIARPESGYVVIRGTAGSGKTTVALHRIAWLAFEDPAIDSPATMVLVFSPALRDYVGHVLPALGVQRVSVRTFGDWAAEQRRRLFPKLPREARDDAPAPVTKLKLQPALAAAFAEHVRRNPGDATPKRVLDDWGHVLTDAALLGEVLAREAPGALSASELERAVDWQRRRLDDLRGWLRGEEGSEPALDPEDDALLLRAWQLRMGAIPGADQRPLRYRHIAIDEVQDFSALEVQVLLGCLDERRSLTLAGDTQQHVVEHGGFTSWGEFLDRLGLQGTEVSTLEVSYRCTAEIAGFASGVLGDLREEGGPPRTVRNGPPVELFRFTDHGAAVAFLADALARLVSDEPYASVVVLTPSTELSALYHRGLETGEVPKLRRVVRQDFSFAPGVEVTEIEQVKGLEFDYVILVEVSSTQFPATPAARRRLHVGATRAVHQLWLTSVGTPAAAVRDQLADV